MRILEKWTPPLNPVVEECPNCGKILPLLYDFTYGDGRKLWFCSTQCKVLFLNPHLLKEKETEKETLKKETLKKETVDADLRPRMTNDMRRVRMDRYRRNRNKNSVRQLLGIAIQIKLFFKSYPCRVLMDRTLRKKEKEDLKKRRAWVRYELNIWLGFRLLFKYENVMIQKQRNTDRRHEREKKNLDECLSQDRDISLLANDGVKLSLKSAYTSGKSACKILKAHGELLKDDPERLTTDFLTTLSCSPDHRKKYLKKKFVEKVKFDPDEKWKEITSGTTHDNS